MKKYLFAVLIALGLFAAPKSLEASGCKAVNLLPASRTVPDSSTVLSWQINCRQPVFGHFLFMQSSQEGSLPYIFYSPTESFALGPYLNTLFKEVPIKYSWFVEVCYNPTCTDRSAPSVSKTIYQLN